MDNWRLCVFFEIFYCITVLIFCKIFSNHQIKPFITPKPKNDHVAVYSRNKPGQNTSVFFQKLLNSRSVFGAIRSAMVFNRNLGPLIMYEWQFTKCSIDYLDNWRLCVFFENFYCITVLIFCKKNLNHQKKALRGIKKNSKTFFSLNDSLKMIMWPYI